MSQQKQRLIPAERILIVNPGWVGDTVMATPFYSAVREAYPDAHITVLIKAHLKKILSASPDINEFIVDTSKKSIGNFRKLARDLKARNFNLGFLLSNSFRTALLLAMAGVTRRVGYRRSGRGFLLTDFLTQCNGKSMYDPIFMGDYYACLAESCAIENARQAMRLTCSDEELSAWKTIAEELSLADDEFVIALNPGASYGAAKCWVDDYFVEVGDELSRLYNARILILAGPGEEAIVHAIQGKMKSPADVLLADQIPLTLLKAVIKRCQLLITNDTGPRHYAVALQVPVITILGSTHPEWGDSRFEHARNLQLDVDCGPCMKRVCPIDHHCMRDLKPALVLQSARELIQTVYPDRSPKNEAQPIGEES